MLKKKQSVKVTFEPIWWVPCSFLSILSLNVQPVFSRISLGNLVQKHPASAKALTIVYRKVVPNNMYLTHHSSSWVVGCGDTLKFKLGRPHLTSAFQLNAQSLSVEIESFRPNCLALWVRFTITSSRRVLRTSGSRTNGSTCEWSRSAHPHSANVSTLPQVSSRRKCWVNRQQVSVGTEFAVFSLPLIARYIQDTLDTSYFDEPTIHMIV